MTHDESERKISVKRMLEACQKVFQLETDKDMNFSSEKPISMRHEALTVVHPKVSWNSFLIATKTSSFIEFKRLNRFSYFYLKCHVTSKCFFSLARIFGEILLKNKKVETFKKS